MEPSADPTDSGFQPLNDATHLQVTKDNQIVYCMNLKPYKDTPWGRIASMATTPESARQAEQTTDVMGRLAIAKAAQSMSEKEWEDVTSQNQDALADLNLGFARKFDELARVSNCTSDTPVTTYKGYSINPGYINRAPSTTRTKCICPEGLPTVSLKMMDKNDTSKGISSFDFKTSARIAVTDKSSGIVREGHISRAAFQHWASNTALSTHGGRILGELHQGRMDKATAESRFATLLGAEWRRHFEFVADQEGLLESGEPSNEPLEATLSDWGRLPGGAVPRVTALTNIPR